MNKLTSEVSQRRSASGPRKRQWGRRMAAAALALSAGHASAQVSTSPSADWQFSYGGFGTLGAVHHGASGVEFRRDISQGDAVKSNGIGFSPDTNLGWQLSARFRQEFEASVQLVSRTTTSGDYGPELSLAFVKYRPQENLAFRAGRLGIEMYLQGDSAEIGYANLMIRQPVIFYPRTFDGLDAEWSASMGDGILRTKAFGGWTQGKLASGATYDTNGSFVRGSLMEYTQGGWTARVAAGALSLRGEVADANWRALQAMMSAAPNGGSIMARLSMKDRTISYASMAVAYDSDALQGAANFSREVSNGWPARQMFFGNIGYRLGSWTPFIGYAAQRTHRDITPTGIPAGFPFKDQIDFASGVAQAGLLVNQTDWALGVRYDFARNTALKLQLDRIRYKDPEGLIDTSLPTTRFEDRRYKSVTLFSAALDFVF